MIRTQHRRLVLAPAIAALLAFAACTPQAPPPDPAAEAAAAQAAADAAKAALDELRAKYLAAENAGDAAAVAALYTDDGAYMAPNAPAASGKAAIQAAYEQLFGLGTVQVSSTPASVEIAGDWGIDQGSYKLTVTPKAGGAPLEDMGKYVAILRKSESGWNVRSLIWNSDMPLPGAAK